MELSVSTKKNSDHNSDLNSLKNSPKIVTEPYKFLE